MVTPKETGEVGVVPLQLPEYLACLAKKLLQLMDIATRKAILLALAFVYESPLAKQNVSAVLHQLFSSS